MPEIRNPVPERLARVIDGSVGHVTLLGHPGAPDVFVTAAEDIRSLTSRELARRLTIPSSASFLVIEFEIADVRGGIASPVNRPRPGFVGKGRTAGGAREFVIANQPVPQPAVMRRVRS